MLDSKDGKAAKRKEFKVRIFADGMVQLIRLIGIKVSILWRKGYKEKIDEE